MVVKFRDEGDEKQLDLENIFEGKTNRLFFFTFKRIIQAFKL